MSIYHRWAHVPECLCVPRAHIPGFAFAFPRYCMKFYFRIPAFLFRVRRRGRGEAHGERGGSFSRGLVKWLVLNAATSWVLPVRGGGARPDYP